MTYRLALEWRRYSGVLIPLGVTIGLVIPVIAIWNRRLQAQIVQRERRKPRWPPRKETADQANRAPRAPSCATMSHEIRTP